MGHSDLWTNLRRWAWSGFGMAGMAVASAGPWTSPAFGGDAKSCAAVCIPESAVQNGKVSCTTTAIPYVCTTAPGKNSCADVCVPPSRVTVGTKGSCTDVCIPSNCVTQSAIANPDLLPASTSKPAATIQQTAAVQQSQPAPQQTVAPALTETKPATSVDVDPFADWLPAGAKSQKQAESKAVDLFDLPTKSLPKQTASVKPTTQTASVEKPEQQVKPLSVCLVALRNEKKLVPANDAFTAVHGAKTYHFSSVEALAEFNSHPDVYVPVANGRDVVAQASHGETPGTIEHALWFRNRLYLFANATNATQFVNHPTKFAATK